MQVSFGHLGTFVYGSPQILPTPPQILPPAKKSSSKDTSFVYKLSKDTCAEALKNHVKSLRCKTEKPAYEGHISDIKTFNVLEVHTYRT